jgi:hypothetical protein
MARPRLRIALDCCRFTVRSPEHIGGREATDLCVVTTPQRAAVLTPLPTGNETGNIAAVYTVKPFPMLDFHRHSKRQK